MPRGQKSKLRAREKRRRTQEQPANLAGAQASAQGGGEFRPRAQEEEEFRSSAQGGGEIRSRAQGGGEFRSSAQGGGEFRSSAQGGGEFRSAPSSNFKHNPQSSAAAGTTSNPQGPSRAPSATAAAAVSHTRSNGSANNQAEGGSFQAQQATDRFPRGLRDEKVMILVYYLLYKYQMKEPITKAEMLRNIIQMHKSHYLEILMKAAEHLELIFGLDMKEMDPNKHIYVLVNKLELSYDSSLIDEGIPKTGLLMTILGVIFMRGNCATEEQLWEIMNAMGLYKGRYHLFFGEPSKFLTRDLVKEKYLECRQVANSYPARYEFLWGPRAHIETSKMKVLEFLAKVHGTLPSAFPSRYEEALRDQEERAQARAAARARMNAIIRARSEAMCRRSSHPCKV